MNMKKDQSVKIPVSEQMLKELKQTSARDDVDITDATRMFWKDWIAGNLRPGTVVCFPAAQSQG